jgi:hypothetical protein
MLDAVPLKGAQVVAVAELFVPEIATQRRGSLQVIATRSYPIRDSKALLHFEESKRLQKSVSSRPAGSNHVTS